LHQPVQPFSGGKGNSLQIRRTPQLSGLFFLGLLRHTTILLSFLLLRFCYYSQNAVRYYFDFETGELKNKNIKHVIDISTWQDEINFEEVVKTDLVDAIIVRIGFGSLTGEPATLDNKFERNISEIKRLGIPYGIYFYGYAQNEEAAEVEATEE
jgi:hypothetical protein